MAGTEPTPVADESTAVGAAMAGDAVADESLLEPELAGEPGTLSERTAVPRERGGTGDDEDDEDAG